MTFLISNLWLIKLEKKKFFNQIEFFFRKSLMKKKHKKLNFFLGEICSIENNHFIKVKFRRKYFFNLAKIFLIFFSKNLF